MKTVENLQTRKLVNELKTEKKGFAMKKLMNNKFVITCMLTFLSISRGMAQADVSGITDKIGDWSEGIKLTLNAGVGAFAIVGGFIIFLQYMQGNDQAQKNFVKFVIGLAIFGLVGLIANVFLPEVGAATP